MTMHYHSGLQCNLEGYAVDNHHLELYLGGPCDMEGAITFADRCGLVLWNHLIETISTYVNDIPDTQYRRVDGIWKAYRPDPSLPDQFSTLLHWLNKPDNYARFYAHMVKQHPA